MASYDLQQAIQQGNLETLKQLIEHAKQDPNEQDVQDEWNALHWASNYGKLNLIDYLLPKMSDVNAKTRYKYTALHLAAANNNEQVCTRLLENGADPSLKDITGTTAAQSAQRRGYEGIRKLIEEFNPLNRVVVTQNIIQNTMSASEEQLLIHQLKNKVEQLEGTVGDLTKQLLSVQEELRYKNELLQKTYQQLSLTMTAIRSSATTTTGTMQQQ
jgi:ankyrin repeat protein